MNKDMENSYLIQRLQKPIDYHNPFVFGGGFKNGGIDKKAFEQISKIFSFDYMGAAEFEFGALPKTLEKIFDNADDFIKGSKKVHWKTSDWKTNKVVEGNDDVYYLCHKDHEKEVKKRIAGWAMNKNVRRHPKCGVQLHSSFHDRRCLGWIEFDNGFFFFIDKKMSENTSELFGIK